MKESYRRASSAGKPFKEENQADLLVRRKFDEKLVLEKKKLSLPGQEL